MGWQDRDYSREETYAPWRPHTGLSVTLWLLIINCVVFILDGILGASRRGSFLAPSQWGAFSLAAMAHGQVWRLVTYQFVHAGFFHILFNMIGLYFFGPVMENWWGSRRYLVFYLLCGMSGALVFALMSLVPQVAGVTPSTELVGASGAIFGILVGCALVAPNMRVMLLIPPIPVSMRTMALVFLGLAVLALVVGSTDAGGQAAHLGGAALGLLLVKQPWLIGWADHLRSGRRHRDYIPDRGSWWQRKREARQSRNLQREDAEVDRILAKVREHGLQSLTRGEKKTLQRATDRHRRAG